MSDLSRLRAKWVRLDKRLAKLKAERDRLPGLAMGDEPTDFGRKLRAIEAIKAQIVDAEASLKYVKRRVAWEEKRLLLPDSKLRFT